MSLLPPWPSGPDAQVRLAPLTNSEHHTSRLFACSPLQLYPEVWYHTTTEIKVGDQTWTQSLERDTLLSRYRLGSSYLLMEGL